MSATEVQQLAVQVAKVFERLGIAYEIGGSLASSLHGVPRATLDADIVADLPLGLVPRFIAELGPDFYSDDIMIGNAVRAKRSFNVIHLGTALKIDVFSVKNTPFAQIEFSRRRRLPFPDANGPEVWVCSPENIVLHKLMWFASGGQVSERQFRDAVGVLRVCAGKLDEHYLRRWAAVQRVNDLLEKALTEAGKPT